MCSSQKNKQKIFFVKCVRRFNRFLQTGKTKATRRAAVRETHSIIVLRGLRGAFKIVPTLCREMPVYFFPFGHITIKVVKKNLIIEKENLANVSSSVFKTVDFVFLDILSKVRLDVYE